MEKAKEKNEKELLNKKNAAGKSVKRATSKKIIKKEVSTNKSNNKKVSKKITEKKVVNKEKKVDYKKNNEQETTNKEKNVNLLKETVNIAEKNGYIIKVEDNQSLSKRTKVLYVVSECQPFCATGGLADIAGSLPKYIDKNKDFDIRVILPLYSSIPSEFREKMKFIGKTDVTLAWRSIYCGVFSLELDNVIYYFLDNEHYFKRENGIYSYFDDGERFAFMSKAIIDVLQIIDFVPDIMHCNDWQSALIPVYLKTNYYEQYGKIKTIFTLHNTEFQGRYNINLIEDLFGIDKRFKKEMEFNGDLNLVKAAICFCDRFTTVSKTYAQEILSSEHSNGLDPILRDNAYKIRGIVNCIDKEFYNPQSDKVLWKNYSLETFKDKVQNKVEFQKTFGLEVDKDIPMISIVSRLTKQKGLDIVRECLENILQQRVQFVAVGPGDSEYQNYFRYLENKYNNKVRFLSGYSNENARKVYAASDIFLMPSKSEPCGVAQLIASTYGSVPIVRETGGLKDTIKDFGCENGGNGYTFSNYNSNDLAYSINRAIKDYNNILEWDKKIQICMSQDFGWHNSANEYVELYKSLLK